MSQDKHLVSHEGLSWKYWLHGRTGWDWQHLSHQDVKPVQRILCRSGHWYTWPSWHAPWFQHPTPIPPNCPHGPDFPALLSFLSVFVLHVCMAILEIHSHLLTWLDRGSRQAVARILTPCLIGACRAWIDNQGACIDRPRPSAHTWRLCSLVF